MDDIGQECLIKTLGALCLRHRIERFVYIDAHEERKQ